MDWLLDQALSRIITEGDLVVKTASGRTLTYGSNSDGAVAVRFTSRRWQLAVLVDPELRLGEAYVDGGFVVDRGSIADFLDLIIRNLSRQPETFWSWALRKSRAVFRRLLVFNVPSRSSRNARHHYNIDHRLYRLFLDSDLQYSCAYFKNPNMTIDEAQAAKKEHISNKLCIEVKHPGTEPLRVLDIGSGWGGLGLHLARHYGVSVVGINLSDEQVSVAQMRSAAEGLPCRFRIQDYRAVAETFDRIVSVGMFEHVGRQFYEVFFRKCFDILANDGVMLLHTIGRWDGPAPANPWVWKYIFPGGYAPALSELTRVIERSGFIVSDIEVLKLHYAETLKRWRQRFVAKRTEVIALLDERFFRMWEFYLAGFEPSFRYSGLTVFQVQLVKRLDATPMTRDYQYSRPQQTGAGSDERRSA